MFFDRIRKFIRRDKPSAPADVPESAAVRRTSRADREEADAPLSSVSLHDMLRRAFPEDYDEFPEDDLSHVNENGGWRQTETPLAYSDDHRDVSRDTGEHTAMPAPDESKARRKWLRFWRRSRTDKARTTAPSTNRRKWLTPLRWLWRRKPRGPRKPSFITRWLEKPRPWYARAIMFTAYWGAVATIWVALIVAGLVTVYSYLAEDPLKAGLSQKPATLTILAAGGKVITEKGLRRDHIPLGRMPRHLINAVLATEDRRFYYHFGFDPIGIIRAAISNYRAGRIVEGGSTITQQLSKVLFLKPDRTYWRKVEEVLLALWLEYRFDKEQILELYLNRVYFGAGNNGVEAAAQHYFGKSVTDLGIYEAAIIAGLIKSPSYFAPTRNLDRARARGKVVLQNMLNVSDITRKEYEQALAHPPELRHYLPSESYGYVTDWVVQLVSDFRQTLQEDIVVTTTIDYELQGVAQRIVTTMMAQHGDELSAGQCAVVILDMNGAVKALVGGRQYSKSQFNRAVAAKRQPGSTFKPFVYLAGLEKGLTPESEVYDGPVQIGDWSPHNYNDHYYGDVTLRRGLAHSLNTVAVRVAEWAGRDRVIEVAHRLGIQSEIKNHPSLALGTSEVSLLEITSAYVPFANGGYRAHPHVIKSIRDAKGRVLFAVPKARPNRIIEAHLVSAMNDMLTATIQVGTGQRAALDPHPAAGKTGTGQNYRDAWFIGYTAHYVTGVWLGNDDFTPMKRITGGSLPTMIWHNLMVYAHINKQPASLPGGDWKQVGSWEPRRKLRSLWESIFGALPTSETVLGSPGSSAPQAKSRKRSWQDDVFSGD